MSNPLARRARIKDLSNKAEGIFQYVGNDNVLFRLISTGNKLTSDVNYAVALFTGFARSHQLGSQETRRTIDSIYRREAVIRGMPDNYKGPAQNPYTVSLVQPGVGHGNGYTLDEYDDDFFARFTRQEEPRDRKLVFRCTKSELDAIKRYANIIDIKFTEEEIHHA